MTDSTQTRADLMLKEALSIMEPLTRILVANGVTYPTFAQALKDVFLRAAQAELIAEDKKVTDSALSLRSGVHRKNVRQLTARTEPAPVNRALSLATEVATRWATGDAYIDAEGKPLSLPVRSSNPDEPSFERLTRSVSKDFHARSVLDEMLRLGVVRIEADRVSLTEEAFVPQGGFAEAAFYFGLNVRDHLAAAEKNLLAIRSGERAPYIEHAMYADELTPESVQELQQLSKKLWLAAFKRVVRAAQEAIERDAAKPPGERNMRMRFGSYFFGEQAQPAPAESENEDPAPGGMP